MATSSPAPRVTYRFLGDSGLLVSKFSLGGWMNYDEKYTAEGWYELMQIAFERGVNFFDTAEIYGGSQSETHFGEAIKKGIDNGVWSREDLVVSTKLFFGTKLTATAGPNDQGLSRKHIVEGAKNSLKRLQLDYVDVIFCHRPDPFTPIEETVRAMNFVIEQGWAFYWGTSEWSAADFTEACVIADRLGLIRPIVEQAQYNIYERSKVEFEYADLYKKYKLGLTIWSPLAGGFLTGKYSGGVKLEGSRLASEMAVYMPNADQRIEQADKLKVIADELGCSLVHLALAWCAANENVSTVLLGAKTTAQLRDNLGAIAVIDKITPEIKAKIDAIVPLVPKLHSRDGSEGLRARHL